MWKWKRVANILIVAHIEETHTDTMTALMTMALMQEVGAGMQSVTVWAGIPPTDILATIQEVT